MSLKSAFRSKKQRPDWATAVENLRRALNGLTQAELAKSVGVSAPIVSQWESGTRKPSPSVFVRMANIAPDPLCFQFWDFADIHAATLLRLAPDIEKRIRAAVSSESGIVRVPLLRDLNQILTPGIPVAEEIESWIPLPANEVPNPASTSCVLLPQGHGFSVFSEGRDFAIVDASQADREKLWNELIVAYLPVAQAKLSPGVYVGRLHRLSIGDREDVVLTTMGQQELELLTQLDIHIPERKKVRVQPLLVSAVESGQIVLLTSPEWRLLGRVIGWHAYKHDPASKPEAQ